MAQVLMHICCAPDATVGVERLKRFGEVLGVFHNPNIEPLSEYHIREVEARRLAALVGFEYYEEPPDRAGWRSAVAGYEGEPERGERCWRCIAYTLDRIARRAAELSITAFATTLTASPHKDVAFIHKAGAKIASEYDLEYINETLRRQGGFRRSLELSQKYGIYRQHYCGCRWSLAEYCRRKGIPMEEFSFSTSAE